MNTIAFCCASFAFGFLAATITVASMMERRIALWQSYANDVFKQVADCLTRLADILVEQQHE
jgi:hypothetical protein